MSILNLDELQDKAPPIDTQPTEPTEPTESAESPDEKVVVMDGPLSKIYTEALNLVYAKEAASASGQTDVKILFDEEIEAQNAENQKALYVYCCDGDDLDMNKTIDVTDKLRLALDSGKYKKVMMVLESHRGVTSRMALLDEYAKENGVQMFFSRYVALNALHDF